MNTQHQADTSQLLKSLEDMLADGDLDVTVEQEAILAEIDRVEERLTALGEILDVVLALTSAGFPPPDEALPAVNGMMMEAIVLTEYYDWLHEQLLIV